MKVQDVDVSPSVIVNVPFRAVETPEFAGTLKLAGAAAADATATTDQASAAIQAIARLNLLEMDNIFSFDLFFSQLERGRGDKNICGPESQPLLQIGM